MDHVRELSSGWMLVLAAVIVKSVLVLVVAGVGYLVIRRLRPAVRAAWLQSAIAAVALLPLLSVSVPQWSLDVLPRSAQATASVAAEPVDARPVFPAEWEPAAAAGSGRRTGPLEPSREVAAAGAGEVADAGAPDYETSPRVAEADAIRTDRPAPSAASSNVIGAVVARGAQLGRGWTAAAMAVYFAGVAVCLASLACKLWSLRRWRRGCIPICDQKVLSRLDMWRRRLGVRRSVRAVTHERVGVPTTFGWLRATVVLQRALFEPGNEALLDAALVHELAHIRRGDLWWTLFDLLVAAFYWPNPFVWWALRRLVALRELACDDWCASVLEKPSEYSANLKEIAIMARRGMMTGLNASMARRPDILNRLVRLEAMRFLPNPRLRWRHWAVVAAATLAVCAGCASGRLGTRKPAAQSAPAGPASQTLLSQSRAVAPADTREPGMPFLLVAKARQSDGTPAKGARAVLCTDNEVNIYNGLVYRSDYVTCELDDSGEFRFAGAKVPCFVAVVADDEYAVVSDKDLEASNEITLKPFCRVEGQITQLSRPDIGREVSLEQSSRSFPYDQPGITWSFGATAGADGKFVFEKVPAGAWLLARAFGESAKSGGFLRRTSETLRLQLEPGQTDRVTMSNPGRAVTGRVTLGDPAAVSLESSFATFGPYIPDEAVPKDVNRENKQAFSDWWHKWGGTPEGRKFWTGKRSFWSNIGPDGGFKFENVPPGKFDVTVNLYPVAGAFGGGYGGHVSVSKTVDVVEAKEGESEILDAGVLKSPLLSPVTVGDEVPEFVVEAIDGRDVKSSDFAGRHLIIYFWSSRNRASRAGMKVLNQLWDECGKDGKVALLGVNYDDQADVVRQFAAETQVAWPQAAGGACAGVVKDLGVTGLPTAVVVDPDGKVTLVTADASEAADAVRKALGVAAKVIEVDPSTLEAVLAGAVEPGTVILLADGEYAGQYRLSLRGTEAAPVRITARGKSAVIGEGSVITLSGAQWVEIEGIACNRMEIFDSANCRVAGCVFDGQGASNRITMERSRRITIEDCEIANGKQYGMRVYGGCEHVAIRRNYIHDNGACAMTIIPLEDGDRNPGRFLTIEGNRIARNCTARAGAAINLGNVRDCTVVNNLLYGNAGGISVLKAETDSANERAVFAGNIVYTAIEKGLFSFRLEEACSDFVVKNNIFWGGSDGAVNVGQDCLTGLDMDYNMIGNDAGRPLLGRKPPTGEGTVYTVEQWQNQRQLDAHSLFQAGPGFVSVENDDYRPAPDSPAVDRGADLSGVLAGDIDGTPRPLGSGFDMGCYEYGDKGEAARPKASPEKLVLTVLEKETGAPVSAATVDVSVGSETWQGKTDDAGLFVIDLLAGSPGRIGVKVSKPGLASARLSWDAPTLGMIPKDYALRMIKAVSIGGAVKDVAGQPVPGVLVAVSVPGVSTVESFALADEKFETDGSGVWQCDAMPSGEHVVAVAYTHRDYVMADGSQAAQEASLLRRTALALMRPKLRLEGVVVNDAGEGVPAVLTLDSADRVYRAYPDSTRSGKDGRFIFDDAAASARALIVTADGYAACVESVSITKEMGSVRIVLARGGALRGHVLESDGTPVPGAFVSIMKWRQPQDLPWSATTDSSGYFEWTSAPLDAVTVSVRKDGYRASVAELSASQPDNKVILLALPRVTGTVTDAETGQKIQSFVVVCGELPENWGRINWNLEKPTQGSGGSYLIEKPFDTSYGEPVLEYHLRAEARGYKTAEKSVKLGEGDIVCDFALEKGASIVAKARRSDGTPAKGARAVLSAPNQVSIYNAQLDRRNYSTCELDDSGEFWFAGDKTPFVVAIVADSEYAVVSDKDLEASNEVTLKPFGRVEGRITQLSKPNIGGEVSLEEAGSSSYDQPGIRWDFAATAGRDGEFVFEKVPAGVWLLARTMDEPAEGGGGYRRHIETLRLQLAGGQTVRVTMSDPGRAVTGRVALGDPPAVNLRESYATFGPYIPDEAVPKDVRRDDPQSFSNWWHKWGETPEGREFWMGKRSFWSKINPDGGFTFENVPPGKYDVTVNIYTVSGGGYAGQVSTSKTVEVAEAKEGDSEILDAGVLKSALLSPLKAGDDVPAFAVAAIDGRGVKSSDFAGRHLVLYFWSSRNRASRAGMKVLNQLWEECGKDSRFALLGVNSDDQADVVRQFAADTQVNWPQAAGGACAGVARDLGVAGLPAAVVVGPDGKVTLVTADASEAADAVRKALGAAK